MTYIIDPTYLRTIHDGLVTGSVNKDNASSLPYGLVGLYEEALPPLTNAADRQKFNEFFAVWALLKKEVSTSFMVPLLEHWFIRDVNIGGGQTQFNRKEQQVTKYLAGYSKWFNSPSTGLYRLYHERLSSFVLQKISGTQFLIFNSAIINQCQIALQQKQGDEWERYALEHLSTHLIINALETGDASTLESLAYNSSHWHRQIEISKGFEWSKRMLKDRLLWAYKCNDDDIIECALKKVALDRLEQNDAPQLIALLTSSLPAELAPVLGRITAFGSDDQDGVQRKFTLYMLCLIELTLLGGMEKPFRKEVIQQLLNHFDEHLPNDHSILNWNDFFPSYLMFLLICEWSALGLVFRMVCDRTDNWEIDWITEMGPYSDFQFDVLKDCAIVLSGEYTRDSALQSISAALAKQGKVEEALECVHGIDGDYEKNHALKEISTELAKHGRLQEAQNCAQGISDDSLRCASMACISSYYVKNGSVEIANSIMGVAINNLQNIGDETDHIKAVQSIAIELVKQEKTTEALQWATGISDEEEMWSTLRCISVELASQGKTEEAMACAQGISDGSEYKFTALLNISTTLAKQENGVASYAAFSEALIALNLLKSGRLYHPFGFDNELANLPLALAKNGMIKEALDCTRGFKNEVTKSDILKDISVVLENQLMFEAATSVMQQALECAKGIMNPATSRVVLKIIFTEIAKQGKIESLAREMQNAIGHRNARLDDEQTTTSLRSISIELAQRGKITEAMACANQILDDFRKDEALRDISILESPKYKTKDVLESTQGIVDDDEKSFATKEVSCELLNPSRLNESESSSLLPELKEISYAIAQQGRTNDALTCARKIPNDNHLKVSALQAISTAYAKQGKTEEAESALQEAITCALEMTDWYEKFQAHKIISQELAKQVEIGVIAFDKALTYAKLIENEHTNYDAHEQISYQLTKQGKVEEALECSRNINDESRRFWVLVNISTELAKQGNWSLAERIGCQIHGSNARHTLWFDVANIAYEHVGWYLAHQIYRQLRNPEARGFFLKKLASLYNPTECSKEQFSQTIMHYFEDLESLEKLGQQYSLYSSFLNH